MRKGLSLSLSPPARAAVLIAPTVERGEDRGGGGEGRKEVGAADFEAATHE